MKKWQRIIGWSALALVFVVGSFQFWVFYDLPSTTPDNLRLRTPGITITDRNGRILYQVMRDEGGSQMNLPLDRIPLALQQATIDTEDSRFYVNPGIDPIGMLRAVWINLRGGETLSGGSTITQQVARNLLLSTPERNERSLRRKLREMVLAWQLTQRYSKGEILALYLNQTYYGGMTYGVEAAARTFFGKDPQNLSLAECALLAGLPQSPALYNPFTDLEAARQRRNIVLNLMVKAGDLQSDQAQRAAAEPISLSGTPYPLEAPHFVMLIRSQIDRLYSSDEILAGGGLVVRTTLNLSWQHAAENAVTRQLAALQQTGADSPAHNVNNAAVVALDPHTGEVLAMVGSPNFNDLQHNGAINMAVAARQPGSALKPFIYALNLDPTRPVPWTAASMMLDVTTHFLTHDGKTYTPEDFDRHQHGPVSLRQALASSLNIPAVAALDHVGLDDQLAFLRRLGITGLGNSQDVDVSLALGGGEVSLLDLTGAYAALANGGAFNAPCTILQIQDASGSILYQASPPPAEKVIDPRVAWLISDILSDDTARRLGFPPYSVLNLDRPAAVKTGTTSNFHDNWTVGYTPDLVVGVWVGNAGQEPMRDVTGLSGAGPIWHAVMRDLLAGQAVKEFTRPPGLVQAKVCAPSGLLPTAVCPDIHSEWFIDGTVPALQDDVFRKVEIDQITGLLADEQTPNKQRTNIIALNLPPLAQPWARQQGLVLWSDLLAGKGSPTSAQKNSPGLQLVSPGSGSVYVLTAKLPVQDQQVHIEADASMSFGPVSIIVDGTTVARFTSPPYQFWWPLVLGKHKIWAQATSPDGKSISSPVVEINVQGE